LSAVLADMDGDGDLDVLYGTTVDVFWSENMDGAGTTWGSHAVATGPLIQGSSVVAADVDGDGDIDVVFSNPSLIAVSWYENTAGDGSTWFARTVAPGVAASMVEVVDVDRDDSTEPLPHVVNHGDRIGLGNAGLPGKVFEISGHLGPSPPSNRGFPEV